MEELTIGAAKWLGGLLIKRVADVTIEELFGKEGCVRAAVFTCFDRAIKDWCKNEQIRAKYGDRKEFLIDDLVEYIKGDGGKISSEIQALLEIWVGEIKNDPIAMQWLQTQYLEILLFCKEDGKKLGRILDSTLDWADGQIENLRFANTLEVLTSLEENCLTEIQESHKRERQFYFLKAKCLLFKDIKKSKEYYQKSGVKNDDYETLAAVISGEQEPAKWIERALPKGLSWSNLNEWIKMVFHYQKKFMDYLMLERNPKLVTDYKSAYESIRQFESHLEKTDIAKTFSYYKALMAYWACAANVPGVWLTVFRKNIVNISEREGFNKLMEISMLMMNGDLKEAQNLALQLDNVDSNTQGVLARIAYLTKNEGLYKRLLKNCINKKTPLTVDVCVKLCMDPSLFKNNELHSLLEGCSLENEADRKVVEAKIALDEGKDVPLLADKEIETISEEFIPFVADILSLLNEDDKAYTILKDRVNKGRVGLCEQVYLRVLRKKEEWRPELMEWLKSNRENGIVYEAWWYAVEFEMRCMMGDFQEAKKAAKCYYELEPENEIAFTHYISSLSLDNNQELETLSLKTLDFPFTNDVAIGTVYSSYFQSGYKEIAVEFLYRNVVRLNTTYLKNLYFGQSIQWSTELMGEVDGEVEDGSYVIVDVQDEQRRCEQISKDSLMGEALVGHKKDDIVTFEKGLDTIEVTIIAIVTKYRKLYFDITDEYAKTGGNRGVKFFSFKNVDNIGEQFSHLLKKLDPEAEERQKQMAKLREDYANGDAAMANLIDNNSCYESYVRLLFGDENVYVINPDSFVDMQLGEQSRFILDMPAIMILAAFTRKTQWASKNRFVVASRVREYIHECSSLYRVEELSNIVNWVDTYCDVVVPEKVVTILHSKDSNLQTMLMHSLCLMLDTQNVLVSDEPYFAQIPGIPNRLLTVEAYMKRYEPTFLEGVFHEFLEQLRFSYYK